jgi:DNA repair protein RadC
MGFRKNDIRWSRHGTSMKSDRIKNWPKEERPRERLRAEGAEKLTDAELLAIILRVGQGTFKEGMPGQNASDFARTLLKDFHGLRGLDRAHIHDLLEGSGLGTTQSDHVQMFAGVEREDEWQGWLTRLRLSLIRIRRS